MQTGDRVRCTLRLDGDDPPVGTEGTIVELVGEPGYNVQWDDRLGIGWMFPVQLELVPTPAPTARHPLSARFHAILAELGQLHDRKQSDYGRTDDPFANVRASTEWGVPAWVGAMVRLHDKVRRLQKAAQGGSLANEGAVDSFNDIACYAVIARVLYEEALDAPLTTE